MSRPNGKIANAVKLGLKWVLLISLLLFGGCISNTTVTENKNTNQVEYKATPGTEVFEGDFEGTYRVYFSGFGEHYSSAIFTVVGPDRYYTWQLVFPEVGNTEQDAIVYGNNLGFIITSDTITVVKKRK